MTDRVYHYEWLSRFRAPVAPGVAAEEFQRIEHAEGGLTPRAVVEASRPDEAPLHALFEWDDQRAADAYRLDQARQAISSLRVVVREGQPPVPAFAYVKPAILREDDAEPKRAFVSIADVQSNADLRRDFLWGELRNLEGCLARSVGFAEMEPLREAARQVRRALQPAIEVAASVAD